MTRTSAEIVAVHNHHQVTIRYKYEGKIVQRDVLLSNMGITTEYVRNADAREQIYSNLTSYLSSAVLNRVFEITFVGGGRVVIHTSQNTTINDAVMELQVSLCNGVRP
jgi:hypothetical protein